MMRFYSDIPATRAATILSDVLVLLLLVLLAWLGLRVHDAVPEIASGERIDARSGELNALVQTRLDEAPTEAVAVAERALRA